MPGSSHPFLLAGLAAPLPAVLLPAVPLLPRLPRRKPRKRVRFVPRKICLARKRLVEKDCANSIAIEKEESDEDMGFGLFD